MNSETKTMQVLAIALLTMTIATPVLAGIATNYANHQGIWTAPNQQSKTRSLSPEPVIEKWNYSAPNAFECSPAIADVDGDGKTEVIAGYDYGLVALNSSGNLVHTYWYGVDPTYPESPVVVDVNGDGKLEVLIVIWGYLYCYNGSSDQTILWSAGNGFLEGTPAVGDLMGDGKLVVVIGDYYDGNIFGFNASDGNQLWQYGPGSGIIISSPTLADINEDGKLEALVHMEDTMGYDTLVCLDTTPNSDHYVSALWSFSMGQKYDTSESSPAVADLDNDGHMEIVVGSIDNTTYCVDSTGGLKWSFKTGDNIHSSPTISDIDGDGKLEVLIGSNDHKLYCLSSEGVPKWSYTTGDLIYSSVAVADIDGDRKLDILVGSHDYNLYCFDRTGGLEWSFGTGYYILSSPAVADIDGDGKLEVVFGSSDDHFYCLSVASAPIVPGAYPWPSIGYRGDVRHTGCITDTDKDGLTDNYEICAGTNPLSADTDNDGFTDYQEFQISTNPHLKEWNSNPPITLIPGIGNNATMPGSTFGNYGFTMVTTNASNVVVTSGSSLPPGVNAPPEGSAAFLYLQISGTQMNNTSGAAIYIYYDRQMVKSQGINELTMQIHRWNSTTLQWDAIPSTVTIINSTLGVITAHLNHFSYFAVLGSSVPSSPSSLLLIAGAAGAAIIVVLGILVVKKRHAVTSIGKTKTKAASRRNK
jgi:hypothetical protein